ncbi:hypothetical protein BP1026B_I2028 [Burkholderia pseudomallei 1026b]|uniref:Uncharacterized protein n=1 Tax=Burkholderia pseudomallei (strain 1026b) TaxID=884204 RepID=A0A0H3HJX6_BURP2|nr:hypothetical protein BP1026B_I2028 [Burkholderia pseudomallei 1026b]EIF65541.1 hypothetical protein BP1026A_1164 [Burkholderia pseudomallei 1026a]
MSMALGAAMSDPASEAVDLASCVALRCPRNGVPD